MSLVSVVRPLGRPIVAALFGALATYSFAPYALWPLAAVSLAGLFYVIDNQSSKRAALVGFFWGLGYFANGISWVHVSIATFGGMPLTAGLFLMALLVGYLALFPALFAFINRKFTTQLGWTKYLLVAPALWVLVEWLRGWLLTGFPWLWAGYSQIDSPLAGFAPVAGVDLINLFVALIAGSLVAALKLRSVRCFIVTPAVILLGWILSGIDWVTPSDESTSLALIQGNIAQETKWLPSNRWPTLRMYSDLTREHWDKDIVIWPEAAIPAFEFELTSFLTNLDSAAKMNQSAVITGVVNMDKDKQFYNSVLTVGVTEYGDYQYDLNKRYHKHHLLPFGEFVPFEDILRPLAPIFNLPMSSFSRGDYVQQNVVANGRHLAPALCYEIIFNQQVRDNITEDTDFILTLSNDAWFGSSSGPLQHMEIARMRALETGRPVIRSTNNGVTAVTDHKGKIIAALPQFERAVLTANINSTLGTTPFLKVGSWPVYLWSVIVVLLACLHQLRQSKVRAAKERD